jgi:hypothetical protein
MQITIDEDTTTAPAPEKPELVDTSNITSGVTARRAAEKAQQLAGVLIFFEVEDDNGKLEASTFTRLFSASQPRLLQSAYAGKMPLASQYCHVNLARYKAYRKYSSMQTKCKEYNNYTVLVLQQIGGILQKLC